MVYETLIKKTKNAISSLLVGYSVLGSFYMAGADVTGHPSADNYLSRNQVTQEEILKPNTTGHQSSDLFFGKVCPSVLEESILDSVKK